MHAKQMLAKCMVVGDLRSCNDLAENTDVMVECLQGIKTEQLRRVIEKSHLGSPETVIINMGENDLRRTRNLEFV